MTKPRDDGEADDIAKRAALAEAVSADEAESVADAKRRLAKRSGTNTRDDGDAVVLLTRFAAPRKGIKETFREPDANGIRRAEYHYALTANECNMIATLSRQLAEARAEKIALQNALVIIDGIAVRHEKGGIGKAQRVAREALAHAAAMGMSK